MVCIQIRFPSDYITKMIFYFILKILVYFLQLLKRLNHQVFHFGVPSIEWIGLKITDLSIFELNLKELLFNLTDNDKAIGKSLIEKLKFNQEFEIIKQVKKKFKKIEF